MSPFRLASKLISSKLRASNVSDGFRSGTLRARVYLADRGSVLGALTPSGIGLARGSLAGALTPSLNPGLAQASVTGALTSMFNIRMARGFATVAPKSKEEEQTDDKSKEKLQSEPVKKGFRDDFVEEVYKSIVSWLAFLFLSIISAALLMVMTYGGFKLAEEYLMDYTLYVLRPFTEVLLSELKEDVDFLKNELLEIKTGGWWSKARHIYNRHIRKRG